MIASPTYKATYTGILKSLLDSVPHDGLAGVIAIPLMVAGDRVHALAVEVHLRPVLVELGAITPTRGLFFEESSLEAPGVGARSLARARAPGARRARRRGAAAMSATCCATR